MLPRSGYYLHPRGEFGCGARAKGLEARAKKRPLLYKNVDLELEYWEDTEEEECTTDEEDRLTKERNIAGTSDNCSGEGRNHACALSQVCK